MPNLTVDEAVGAFVQCLGRALDSDVEGRSHAGPDRTPEESEALSFCQAAALLRLTCPELCKDQRCRRGGCCRHIADIAALQRPGARHPSMGRRTPGAVALRHAIWLYMNGPGFTGPESMRRLWGEG